MDYLLAVQGLVVVLMMVLVKEEYRRTSVDKVNPTQDDTSQLRREEASTSSLGIVVKITEIRQQSCC